MKKKGGKIRSFFKGLKKAYEDPKYVKEVRRVIKEDSEAIGQNAMVDQERLGMRINYIAKNN